MTPSELRVRALLDSLHPTRESSVWRAPGRVNVIGEHVDYAGGPVLPFACDRDVLAATEPLDGRVEFVSLDVPGEVAFELEDIGPLEGWGRYVGAVVEALRQAGEPVAGVRGVLSSTVPVGAGLSSSAALEAAIAMSVCGHVPDPKVLQRAEHLAVGVPCGVMDQVAVLHGRSGHAIRLDCAAVTWEHVPVGDGIGFVVVDTRTRRSLDDGRYAQRRQEVEAALAEARRRLGTPDPLTATAADVRRLRLDEPLDRRLRHVVTECRRVADATDALRDGDVRTLGELVAASQASLRHDLDVSSPDLDRAVAVATATDGCMGARLVGAGFAGCVLAVVHADEATAVATSIVATLGDADAYEVVPSDGAGPL